MKNGGGAIMAMGRASGEHRVEKAILNALDSPLLYGNDIGRAKRILFNIYSSDEHPIFVRELQEIDDFFDQLDPNIEVIWGTATDDSLNEDAKVTILATGLEDDLRSEVQKEVHRDEDDFYEDLIPRLYKPTKIATVAEVIQQELPFEVEPAPEEEAQVPEAQPAEAPLSSPEEKAPLSSPEGDTIDSPDSNTIEAPSGAVGGACTSEATPRKPTIIDKWKTWLNSLMKDVTE